MLQLCCPGRGGEGREPPPSHSPPPRRPRGRDTKELRRLQWKFLVVDEGHRLKNLNCRLIKELKAMNTGNRLLLSGTPLQVRAAGLRHPGGRALPV